MKYIVSFLLLFSIQAGIAQTNKLKQTIYRAVLYRKDSNEVVFNLEPKIEKGKTVLYVINDTERLRVTDIKQKGDSLIFNMPFFESSFFTKINKDGSFEGVWVKGTSREPLQWRFIAVPGKSFRFLPTDGNAKKNIAGKWVVTFTSPANGEVEKAVAVFKQQKNKLTGSILTPSGDYRFIEGIVTGDSLKLSTFDGSHAYYFTAKIDSENKISGGQFFAGYSGLQTWTAVKDNNAPAPEPDAPTALKPGETGLNFAFNDLNDKLVSIKDERFINKVVIVQIMGSWCPNCMDETKFLSEFYNNNKKRGVEIIGLAYEYSTDLKRSKASLGKFQQRFNVQYPILITGVTTGDEQRTEKAIITIIKRISNKATIKKLSAIFS